MAFYEPLIARQHPLLVSPKSFILLSQTEIATIDVMSGSSTTPFSFTFHPPYTKFHQRLKIEFLESSIDHYNQTGGYAGVYWVRVNLRDPYLSFDLSFLADYKRRFPSSNVFQWVPLSAIDPTPIHAVEFSVAPFSSTPLSGFRLKIDWCEVIECIV